MCVYRIGDIGDGIRRSSVGVWWIGRLDLVKAANPKSNIARGFSPPSYLMIAEYCYFTR